MNSRERVLQALNHKETDRVPLMYRDVPEVRSRLKRDLGVDSDEELFRCFEIDFRWVAPRWVGPVLDISATERRDHWGVVWQYHQFSDRAGYWNEQSCPMADVTDPAEAATWPLPALEWWDFSLLSADCDACSGYAVMTAPGYSSPGILQFPVQSLIGIQRSLMDLYIEPDFYHTLIHRILEFQQPFVRRMMEAAEGKIDFFRMGDDFGTQQGLLIGINMWREFFQEPLRSLADIATGFGAHYYQHSCGAVRELIPALIETGVEVLDPLQVKAAGMDPDELKRTYGKELCFSGGVDEQELLPFGTPDAIREAVWRLLDVMARDGGFFLGPTHNFQDDIPTGNIVAMYEAALTWSG